MSTFSGDEWEAGGEEYQLKLVRGLSSEALRRVARTYDWSLHPEAVLGWIMARQGIDLATALSVFLKGDPLGYNYTASRDVPDEHRATCVLLDTICLRANSGFYLPLQPLPEDEGQAMRSWLDEQALDCRKGRAGRWVFDAMKVRQVLAPQKRPETEPQRPVRAGFLASLMRPRPQMLQPGRG